MTAPNGRWTVRVSPGRRWLIRLLVVLSLVLGANYVEIGRAHV